MKKIYPQGLVIKALRYVILNGRDYLTSKFQYKVFRCILKILRVPFFELFFFYPKVKLKKRIVPNGGK